MLIVDGKKIAGDIVRELKKLPRPDKFLGVVLVGENSSSLSFVSRKEAVASDLGVDFRIRRIKESVTDEDLCGEVLKLANQNVCGGIIVQLPLPAKADRDLVLSAIPPEKDVDVLGAEANEAFLVGENPVLPPAVCTVKKILEIMDFNLYSAEVAVVGFGFLVGQPIFAWLNGRARRVNVFRRGSDLRRELKNADLVISGVGKPGLIKKEMLKNEAGVIDFGYGFERGRVIGDLDPSALLDSSLAFATVTPGGTGPILVAELFENFYRLNNAKK